MTHSEPHSSAPTDREARANRRDHRAIIGVFATAAAHLLTFDSAHHSTVVIIASAAWLAFIGVSLKTDRDAARRWGFGSENLGKTSLIVGSGTLVAALGLGLYGYASGHLSFPAHGLALLALYPIWGLIQQFLVQGLVVNGLRRIAPLASRPWSIILIGGALFGVVHVYDWPLAVATFGLGLAFVALYLRLRNLWPLGIAHGWLGTLFYLWVLGRDPWLEAFG